MTALLHFNMQDGDWVRGKTNKDELFQGYIESINLKKGTVKIRVTQSDNQKIIGEISDSTPDRIRLLEEMPPDREGHLLKFYRSRPVHQGQEMVYGVDRHLETDTRHEKRRIGFLTDYDKKGATALGGGWPLFFVPWKILWLQIHFSHFFL